MTVICAAAVAGCGKEEPPTPASDTDLSKVEPDFRLSAADFAAECKKDKKAARGKYGDKVIELTGKVVGVGQNIAKEQFLELGAPDGSDLEVICFTKSKNAWLQATPGQTITLRGLWPPIVVIPALVKCQIIKVTGDPCLKLTADELAREYDTDPEGAHKRYKAAKYLILEGEIARKEANEVGAMTIDFIHGGKCKVACVFTAFEKDQTQALAVGQTIQVIGEYMSLSADDSSITLYFCLLNTN